MAAKQWYCMHGGRKVGPLTAEQIGAALSRGQLEKTTPAWTEGMADWATLAQCAGPLGIPPTLIPPAIPTMPGLDPALAAPDPQPSYRPPEAEPMRLWDNVLRALFVAAAVGLAWGIRGQFGGITGAMFPGAVLGLAYCYVSGQEVLLRRMPVIAFATAVGIGLGGEMSYGLLHGYAKADSVENYSYGFLMLFLQGGAWGCLGCAMAGALMERERPTWIDWVGGTGVAIASGMFLWWLVYKAIGFDINPYRTNNLLNFLGAAIGIVPWCYFRRKPLAVRGALWGFVGFGLGMAGGRLMANAVYAMDPAYQINNWNIMELGAGAIGGFIFSLGMVGVQSEDRDSDAAMTRTETAGAIFVMALIPLLHRVTRISGERVEEWAWQLENAGSSWSASSVGNALSMLVLAAMAAAGLWLFLQYSGKERWGWYPVLALSLLMLLFHHVTALYFFKPAQANYVDTMDWYWWIFAFLVAYVAVREFLGGHLDDTEPEDRAEAIPWAIVPALAVGGLIAIVTLAASTNGAETMTSAETRWPLWSYRDGPYPGGGTEGP